MSDDNNSDANRVIKFPQSRVAGTSRNRPINELGLTERAKAVDQGGQGTHGHWCSQCRGVWYGRPGEVECPVCKNRHG
ncbi:MAG: hypothetical protein AAFV69_06315 [Pseudomonadota bacterium]